MNLKTKVDALCQGHKGGWGFGSSTCICEGRNGKFVIGITNFKKKDIHKYVCVSKFTGDKSLTDYSLVRKVLEENLLDGDVL